MGSCSAKDGRSWNGLNGCEWGHFEISSYKVRGCFELEETEGSRGVLFLPQQAELRTEDHLEKVL